MKKILITVLIVALTLSMASVAFAADPETEAGLLLVAEDEEGPEIPPDDDDRFPVSVADFEGLDFGSADIDVINSPGATVRNSRPDARQAINEEFGLRFISYRDFTLQASISGFGVGTGAGRVTTLEGSTLTLSNAVGAPNGATQIVNLVPGVGGVGTVTSGTVTGNVWRNTTEGTATNGNWVFTTGNNHAAQGSAQTFLTGTGINDLAVNWLWATNLTGNLSIPAFSAAATAGETTATVVWTVGPAL